MKGRDIANDIIKTRLYCMWAKNKKQREAIERELHLLEEQEWEPHNTRIKCDEKK